jgi:alcohol dehydrogenase class IV
MNYKDCTNITNAELLQTECDILIPAAIENQIRKDNVDKVRAILNDKGVQSQYFDQVEPDPSTDTVRKCLARSWSSDPT